MEERNTHSKLRRERTARRTRTLFLGLVTALTVLVALPSLADAQPLDFSDTEQPIIQWPFSVVEFEITQDEWRVFQHSKIRESPSEVYDTILQLKEDRGSIGGFLIMGAAQQADGSYTFSLSRDNLKYVAQAIPDGTGTDLVMRATPIAVQTGVFKRALYDYDLGDGTGVGTSRYDHRDE